MYKCIIIEDMMDALILLLSMPGGSEWIIIGLVVLLLFGGKKIPELMRGLGKGVKNFKEGMSEASDEFNKAKNGIDEELKGEDKSK